MLFSFHHQLGLDIEELEEIEEDAGLGNGGLGRLAGKWHCECVLFPDQGFLLRCFIDTCLENTYKFASHNTACDFIIIWF